MLDEGRPRLRLRDLEAQGRQDAHARGRQGADGDAPHREGGHRLPGRSGRSFSAKLEARPERGRQVARRVRRGVGESAASDRRPTSRSRWSCRSRRSGRRGDADASVAGDRRDRRRPRSRRPRGGGSPSPPNAAPSGPFSPRTLPPSIKNHSSAERPANAGEPNRGAWRGIPEKGRLVFPRQDHFACSTRKFSPDRAKVSQKSAESRRRVEIAHQPESKGR